METVKLSFEELGNSDNAPLIILHGFFASSRNWRQVAEKLSANFHVYLLDMRNHGASPHHPLMDYPSMAADVLRFVDDHGLNAINLLGHSMGGKIAMWFALNYPGRVNRLIVVDIAPVSYQHSFNHTIEALKSLPLATVNNRKQAEVWLAEAIPELSYRQFLLQNILLKDGGYAWRIDLDIFYRMAPNIIAFPASDGLLPYTGKTLFIAGADSGYVKPDDIHELFPEARITFITDAGHWLHVQQPAMFMECVLAFLQSDQLIAD
ncbi:MAG: alpha/beta fold hydrolase [Methylococcaceae bacterium]